MPRWNDSVKRKSINKIDESLIWSTKKIEKYLYNQERSIRNEGPNPFYSGNVNLLKPDLNYQYTEDEIREIQKCKTDICYFAEKYCKLTTDDGIRNIELRKYQRRILDGFKNNKYSILISSRQIGKCFFPTESVDISGKDMSFLEIFNMQKKLSFFDKLKTFLLKMYHKLDTKI